MWLDEWPLRLDEWLEDGWLDEWWPSLDEWVEAEWLDEPLEDGWLEEWPLGLDECDAEPVLALLLECIVGITPDEW